MDQFYAALWTYFAPPLTTALTMVFKLCQSAAKKWRGLDGSHRLAEIVEGVKFKDGEADRTRRLKTTVTNF